MEDAYFYLPAEKFDRLAPVYTVTQGKLLALEELGLEAQSSYPKEGPRDLFAGGAGLSMTTIDYAKFIQTLVAGGGNLLGEKAMMEMTKDQMPMVINDYDPERNPGSSFALGFTVYLDSPNKRSPKNPGTYEWGGYFNTKFFIDPSEQLIFVGMTQVVPFQHPQFWNEVYDAIYEAVDN